MTRGGAMVKGGGGMAPQKFEIYIYIYISLNVFKIQSIKTRVGLPKYLNQSNDALKKKKFDLIDIEI